MTKDELTGYIKDNFSGELELIENDQREPYFIVKPENIVEFSRFIHDDPRLQLTFMMNLSGVDTGERFEIVYNVCSYRLKHRIFFKTLLDYENPEVDTVLNIWPAANWYEREVWELFGVNIRNHPNLTRFLLPDDWDDGYPLRKGWVGKNVVPFPERT
jgi:NADH-quinone oxidoreductase subunit C